MDEPRIITTNASGDLSAPKTVTGKAGEFDIVMDQPPPLGGTDKGPGPLQLVTAAVLGCAAQTLAVIARQNGFTYSNAHFETSGDVDVRGFLGVPGVCLHFCDFSGTFTIETDEPQERVDEIAQIVEDRCAVLGLLRDAGVNAKIEWKRK